MGWVPRHLICYVLAAHGPVSTFSRPSGRRKTLLDMYMHVHVHVLCTKRTNTNIRTSTMQSCIALRLFFSNLEPWWALGLDFVASQLFFSF